MLVKLRAAWLQVSLCQESYTSKTFIWLILGRVCFGWKLLPEMLFRKWGCLVGSENSIFRKLKSIDPKKMPLTTEISLHFYFPFKAFLENEREGERERARARERRSVGRRDCAVDRDLVVDRNRRRREIAPSIAISNHDRLSSLMFFSGLWFVFFWICVFLLLFQTPENIFRKTF